MEKINPTDEQKTEAEILFYKISKSDKPNFLGKNLYEELKIKEQRTGIKANEWKFGYPKNTMVAEPSAVLHRKRLRLIKDNITLEEANQQLKANEKIESFENALRGARKFIEKLEELLNIPDVDILRIKNNGQEPSTLNGYKWLAYFLYYLPLEEHDEEALLARAVVEVGTYTLKGKPKEIRFTNTGLPGSVDYYGSSKPFFENGSGSTIIFNLDSGEIGRELHFKMYCSDINQEIMLGEFVTYEDHHTHRGTLMFQLVRKIPYKLEYHNPKPGVFSFKENIDEFEKIDSRIKNFFSLREQNYHKVYRGIKDLTALQTRMEVESFFLKKEGLFLEKRKPIAYFTNPQKSNTGNKLLQSVIKNMEQKFENVIFKHNDKEDCFDEFGIPLPAKRLSKIKSYRFFVMYLDEVKEFSFSFVLFSWALAFSKKVILITNKKSISSTINSIPGLKDYDKQLFDILLIEESKSEKEKIEIITDFLVINITRGLPKGFNNGSLDNFITED